MVCANYDAYGTFHDDGGIYLVFEEEKFWTPSWKAWLYA